MKRIYVDKDEIYNLYVIQQLSTRDVGKVLGIGQTSVRRWLKKYKIPTRSQELSRKTPSYLAKNQENAERYSVEYLQPRTKTCPQCGNEFIVYSHNKNKIYCSEQCISESRKDKKTKYYCQLCGKEIVGYRYKRIYCDDCLSNNKRPWIKKDRIDTNCAYCGKPIQVIKSVYHKNENCYCSTDCMGKHYSIIYSGENSPTWKGGKSHHYVGGFWTARNIARERDNYSCQRCGITEDEYGQQMSVHHIINYREFDDKDEANELDNLICLCEPCHRFIHSNANTEQLFIQHKQQDKI